MKNIIQNIFIAKILHYFDRPLLFLCENGFHNVFLFVLLDEDTDKFIGKEVTESEKSAFLNNEVDLRTIYENNQKPFLIGFPKGQKNVFSYSIYEETVTEEMLPDAGLFYEPKITATELIG